MSKPILYIDLDGPTVDFEEVLGRLPDRIKEKYKGRLDEIPGIFGMMLPTKGAIKAYKELEPHFDIYYLSTAPWENDSAWSDKIKWVKFWLPDTNHKRLILSHHKNLNRGADLIDDRTANGAGGFEGELIQYGTERFPDWGSIVNYLLNPNKGQQSKQIQY